MGQYGEATIKLIEAVFARGAQHAVALMRHSAREYAPGVHDLENPLTPEGRQYARNLGTRLPKDLLLRGYASPPERCMETAQLVLDSHEQGGGSVTRHRPLEALGVFYALDQRKMWKGLSAAGGLQDYLHGWFSGEVPDDAMMAPELAAAQVLKVLKARLASPLANRQLDICVSHDMTLHLLRDRVIGESVLSSAVGYLDALVLFRIDGELRLTSQRGNEVLLEEG